MKRFPMHKIRRTGQRPRAGFTLVELLVVIGILIILTVMTIGLVNVTQDEDRVREGAAQVQSFLEGARDRAIHAKEPRGVRFLRDTQNTDVVTSMLYIGPPENYSEGKISLGDPANSADKRTITLHGGANWNNLRNRGLIPNDGAVIRIGDQNTFYTIRWDAMSGYQLTKDYAGTINYPPLQRIEEKYSLQLNPNVLPNQEPRILPRDVVIDLTPATATTPAHSRIPDSWNSGPLDVLFSPHGTVTGLVSSTGVIHLVVAEGVDVTQARLPGAFDKEGNERIVSLRTQTGGISVHHVDPTGASATANATDPFYFAATGETAK